MKSWADTCEVLPSIQHSHFLAQHHSMAVVAATIKHQFWQITSPHFSPLLAHVERIQGLLSTLHLTWQV